MNKKERFEKLIAYFQEAMPQAASELHFNSPYELICAVILSAQCTDKRVNMVTPELFRRFPTPQEMAKADAEEVFEYVSSVSYPNAKSTHLVQLARKLVNDFGGEVPSDFDALQTLPGVGRKTANVMLAVAFNQAAMPVDTHVFRVSHRLGLVTKKADSPEKVERELVKLIPSEMLSRAHHWLLLHGRYICTARKAHCEKCPISGLCPSKTE